MSVDPHHRDVVWDRLVPMRPGLVRLAMSRGLSQVDAEDVAQEAMLRTAGFAGLDLDRAAAFVSATCVRLCADVHRQSARDERLRLRVVGDVQPGTEEVVCDRDEAAWLAQAALGLGGREAAVLSLRASGHSAAETAVALGISYKAMEGAFSRARRKLRLVWSASLMLLVFLVRRPGRLAAVGVTSVAVAAALLVHQYEPPDVESVSAAPRENVVAPLAAPPVRAKPLASSVVVAEPSAGAVPGRRDRTVAALTPAKPVGPLREVAYRREREDESFLESVQYCLENLSLGPQRYGCD